MAWPAQAIRQMAHELHEHEPLGMSGVLDRVFEQLQQAQVVQIKIEAVSLDSTSIKVHPDGTGARKKTVRRLSASPVVDGTRRSISSPRTRAWL